MSSIPDDVYLEILLRLPVKSTFVCKCVCKTWFSLICDPSFATMHHDFTPKRNISGNVIFIDEKSKVMYTIDHDSLEPSLAEKNELNKMCYPYESLGCSVTIAGSCNGVVCLVFPGVGPNNFFFCLWNPATREYKKITKPTDSINYEAIRMRAFAYDRKNDYYKLVIGVEHRGDTAIYVYTTESNKWKSSVTVPYYFWDGRRSGVLVNGDLHFLAYRGEWQDIRCRFIVSMDVSQERFKETDLSTELKVNAHGFITVAELQGCLCVLLVDSRDYYRNRHGFIELWVMQDYSVRESWTKRYTITHRLIVVMSYIFTLKFIWSSKNGKILLGLPYTVILYNLEDEIVTKRCFSSGSEASYFESLVSVKSGTYMGGGQIEESIELEAA